MHPVGLKTIIAAAGGAWFTLFLAAHFAGTRAKKWLAGFALTGPLVGGAAFAALFLAGRRIGESDKFVFGAAIAAYVTGVLAALELLVRGQSRARWALVLLGDVVLLAVSFLLIIVMGGGAR